MDLYIHHLCNSSNYLTGYSSYKKGLPFDPLVILHPHILNYLFGLLTDSIIQETPRAHEILCFVLYILP